MKMVISPAKSLNFSETLPTQSFSEPCFLKEAHQLNALLKKKSPKSLGNLMHISDQLAQLNWQRNQDFEVPFNPDNARPAIYSFSGDVYQGLDAYSLPPEQVQRLQDQLFILSGLYGLLKPLDLIQPYRLEMGTAFKVGARNNLYAFWTKKITMALNDVLEEDELFVNLASNEYFNAVDVKALKVPVIAPVFKDYKNGKLKVISFFAKKARGMMVRHLIETAQPNRATILSFNADGYRYSEAETVDAKAPVFIR
ncbi:peroxide stress protein YaaA [Flavobacteriaceae bacterium]|jgi:cytoplasmic iron level regulating protein YaaA (DUF328/UPF0246 family)|nr:peroxide stress protein YaaA [Flavobacteriaceae bacterium]MDA7711968.1 peroxide stress protein YaaA [Flavobacteriaceae bacterium]